MSTALVGVCEEMETVLHSAGLFSSFSQAKIHRAAYFGRWWNVSVIISANFGSHRASVRAAHPQLHGVCSLWGKRISFPLNLMALS